ncbi:MAG: TolC family protein, partial [Gammaproteobacteria bacterium]
MFSLRFLISPAFGLLCLFTVVSLAAEQNVFTLAAAVAGALKANPNLAQIKARADAMSAIPSQAGALPDPVVSFNALNLPTDSFDTRQEAMTQMQVGLSQTIPFPGKLALKQEAADFDAGAALKSVDEAKLWLQSQVKTNWWQLYYLDRALEIVDNNQTLLRQFIQIARAKYEVGEGLQQDVLLAQLELSRLLEQQLKLQGLRRNTGAQLNALLNQPTTRPLILPANVELSLPTLADENKLLEQAEQSRAILDAKREMVNAAQSRLDLAKKDYYPDLNVGIAYSGRDKTLNGVDRADFVSFKLSANLPIFFND